MAHGSLPARSQPGRDAVGRGGCGTERFGPPRYIRSLLRSLPRLGARCHQNLGVRGCHTAACPPGPPAPCPERPRASCTCLPAVAEPARAVWGRAVPGTPFPGRRLPPQPRLKTTGTAASGCRGTIPLLPGSPWGAGMGHSGTPGMGHSRTESPGPVVPCFHPEGWVAGWRLGCTWRCPLHGQAAEGVGPQGAVGAAHSVRGWWVMLAGTPPDLWDRPAPLRHSRCSQAGAVPVVVWHSRGHPRGRGRGWGTCSHRRMAHLVVGAGGVTGAARSRRNRSQPGRNRWNFSLWLLAAARCGVLG